MNGYLRARFAILALLVATCSMQGCGITDVFFGPDPTIVQMTVKVANDVNPDSRNQPSPVRTRFYLLKSTSIFKSADFLQLKEQDRELLSGDIMERKERVFKPGQEQQLELSLPAESLSTDEKLYLAIMVGYWDIHNSEWRTARKVRIEETTEAIISIARSAVSIDVRD